ncbi:hypothetical protein [Roseibium sp. M-1]
MFDRYEITSIKGPFFSAVFLAGMSTVLPSAAQTALLVTSGADAGKGSLRDALEAASRQTRHGAIQIVTDSDIEISSSLVYSGQAPLHLLGNGQTVRSAKNVTLLELSEGADLSVSNLNFKGPGGFSLENRGDLDGAGGKGIFVDVREDQTGVVNLSLESVTVSDVAYHGIHVSDCDLADACGGGSGGGGGGAPASISVRLSDVEISHVGNGAFDADGIRVDERGDGDIRYSAYRSVFRDVGADGVELDEGDDGGVYATTVANRFLDNGGYCDPRLLKAFLPDVPDGEFGDGEKAEADIPGPVTGSPDDRCFEREVSLYASGSVKEYEISIDLDDGIDIDEAGNGDLVLAMTDSEISGNLDEEDAGNAVVSLVRSFADHNTDDGFRTSEIGPGDITGFAYDVGAWKNGGNGLRFDETDEGTLSVELFRTTTSDNDDGDDTGVRVTKQGDGEGTLKVSDSDIRDGIDARNVKVEELAN